MLVKCSAHGVTQGIRRPGKPVRCAKCMKAMRGQLMALRRGNRRTWPLWGLQD